MADKATEYKTKSIYFNKTDFDLLEKIIDKCTSIDKSFSDYAKELFLEDINQSKKLPQYMEDRIIELIRKYAPTVAAKDIKEDIKEDMKEFDPEALAALRQFDNL